MAQVFDESALFEAGGLEVVGQSDLVLFESVREPMQQLVHLGCHQTLGQIDLRLVDQQVQCFLTELAQHGPPLGLGEAVGQLGAQFSDRFELGDFVDPVVIEIGKHPGLDLVDLDLVAHRLPGTLAEPVRKWPLERGLLAGRLASQLVVDALNHDSRAHFVEEFGGIGLLDCHALGESTDIDRYEIAVPGRALDRLEAGELLAHAIEAGFQIGLRKFGCLDLDVSILVVRRSIEFGP